MTLAREHSVNLLVGIAIGLAVGVFGGFVIRSWFGDASDREREARF